MDNSECWEKSLTYTVTRNGGYFELSLLINSQLVLQWPATTGSRLWAVAVVKRWKE